MSRSDTLTSEVRAKPKIERSKCDSTSGLSKIDHVTVYAQLGEQQVRRNANTPTKMYCIVGVLDTRYICAYTHTHTHTANGKRHRWENREA